MVKLCVYKNNYIILHEDLPDIYFVHILQLVKPHIPDVPVQHMLMVEILELLIGERA